MRLARRPKEGDTKKSNKFKPLFERILSVADMKIVFPQFKEGSITRLCFYSRKSKRRSHQNTCKTYFPKTINSVTDYHVRGHKYRLSNATKSLTLTSFFPRELLLWNALKLVDQNVTHVPTFWSAI